jgi:site-specific DNA-adenine methylase
MINFDFFGKPYFSDVESLRIPYMGSKRKIAKELFEKMIEMKPKAKYFFDLCGGGASMSFFALQIGLKVHYNEKQKGLVDLLEYILKRARNGEKGKYGLFPDDFYKFITREEFMVLKNENSIKGQFARICYSFGNNQRSFLFGDIEAKKHLAHNIVMFQDQIACEEFNDLFKMNIKVSDKPTWNERRLDYMSYFTKEQRRNAEERLQQLERFEQLEQLQQLERLQQLEQLPAFTLTNLHFQDVKIETPIEETIVYLDPPYRGTTKYLEKDTLHIEIDNYFINSPYTCFMSEYNAPHKQVFEIKKTSLLNNYLEQRKMVIEKLYWNER